MKKIIQFLLIILLLIIIALVIIFFFNPGNLKNKIAGNMINSYLSSKMSDYQPVDKAEINANYNHPALSETQEKTLYDMGVDVSQLPTSLDPATSDCLASKVSPERLQEIIAGAVPSPLEIYKAQTCLK